MKAARHAKSKRKLPQTYRAVAGSRISHQDAQLVGEHTAALVDKNGVAKPEAFVAAAIDPKSKVHHLFIWDDALLAKEARLDRARQLMRSFTVVVETKERGPTEIRGVHYLDSKGGYMPAATVFSDVDLTKELVERAKRDLIAIYHRCQRIRSCAELAGVFDAIEESLLSQVNEAA